jgi:hypothetical protein
VLWGEFAKKKEALLAFAAACSKSLSTTAQDLRTAVHQKMIAAGKSDFNKEDEEINETLIIRNIKVK